MAADFNEKSKVSKNSLCESCGEDFFCGAETGNCWCFEVKIAPETLTEVGQKYDKCLCPTCLFDEEQKNISESKSQTS